VLAYKRGSETSENPGAEILRDSGKGARSLVCDPRVPRSSRGHLKATEPTSKPRATDCVLPDRSSGLNYRQIVSWPPGGRYPQRHMGIPVPRAGLAL